MASSAQQQPVVEGSNIRITYKVPSTFTSSTLPSIHENTVILAVTHPSMTSADPAKDGSFISDFYAFNYLLKGEGQEQTWLTATAPEEVVDKYGSYLHGNPHGDGKVCLDREILDQNQLTNVTVVQPSDMIERFLSEAKRASELAKRTDAPLLLLIFCHGLPNHHFLLDDENRENNLSMRTLKDVLAPGTRTTLVTTGCYSGGWAVTPDLNITASTGAGPTGDLLQGLSLWDISPKIERSCGSIFAGSIFQELSSAASPLLDDPRQSEQPDCEESLQPQEPTDEQTLAYDAFRQSVLDACQNTATRLSSSSFQHFTFSAQNDDWEYSWTGRTGIPLAHFEERWKRLKAYPYTGSEENKTKQAGEQAEEAGNIVDTITDQMAHERLKEMARIFHNTTCPYDWTLSDHVSLSGRLFCFYKLGLNLEQAGMLEATMRFRWEAALLADYIVETFRLPVPWNEICIMWHDNAWANAIEKKLSASEYSQRWLTILAPLKDFFDFSGSWAGSLA